MESLTHFILAFSYLGLFVTIFIESGLFFGFFLPGDSLLFTAGLFAAKGDLNIALVILSCFVAAVLGVQVGYLFGNKVGKRLYSQKDSFFFRQEHIEKTKAFYAKYGKMTIILARFTPIVRTFAPIVAGVSDMNYRDFVTYNMIGGLLWGIGLPSLGYLAGNTIPNIDHYLLPILVIIIIASVIPGLWHMRRSQKKSAR